MLIVGVVYIMYVTERILHIKPTTPAVKTGLTLSQRVVATLSRIKISPRDIREIVSTIRTIHVHGLYQEVIPPEMVHIYEALACDGIISKDHEDGKVFYTRPES